jgi:SAM-dependent methyltransferase
MTALPPENQSADPQALSAQEAALRQKAHYEQIHDDYTAHYYDPTSNAYRVRFILKPLFKGLPLDDQKLVDLACGNGSNSQLLREIYPELQTEGIDISANAVADYASNLNAPCYLYSLTEPLPPDLVGRYDAAMVIGGLHHCVSNLDEALRNAARLVRPDGHFLMLEPNARYLLQSLRDFWYRNDKYFDAETEAALDADDLIQRLSPWFEVEKVRYIGGPAYFIIINILVMRMPLWLKRFIAAPLFAVEYAFNALPGRWLFPAFMLRLKRKDTPAP